MILTVKALLQEILGRLIQTLMLIHSEGFSVNSTSQSKISICNILVQQFLVSSYTGYVTSSTGWLLWTKKTTTNTARSVSTVTPETLEPECPVVWRQWPHDNATIGGD